MDAAQGGTGWEPLFWLVFEHSSNPLILVDSERQVIAANDAALTLFGRSRGEVAGTSVDGTIVPSERASAARDWQTLRRNGEYEGTRDLLLPDGSQLQVEFAARLGAVGNRELAIYVILSADGQRHAPDRRDADEPALTEREREVVTLIALGRDSGEIAEELGISPETVRTHVRNAMSKLGAHTRAQLVAIALCSGDAIHPDRVRD